MRGIARLEKGNADGCWPISTRPSSATRTTCRRWCGALVLWRARQDADRALADLDRAIAIDGREPSAHVERAVFWFTRKEFTKANSDLDRATELGSRDVIVPILRGQILLENKDTKKAYEAFVNALKADPSRHDAYLGLASVYLMRGQPKNAQAILDDAVSADPA